MKERIMSKRFLVVALVGIALFFAFAVQVIAQASTPTFPQTDEPTKVRVNETYGKLPLTFEANHGQADAQVKFLSRRRGYTLFLTPTEAVLALRMSKSMPPAVNKMPTAKDNPDKANRDVVLRMQLVGANPHPKIAGLDELPGKSNYFIGNDPMAWNTNVLNYAMVRYKDIYPGIDLIYYGDQRQLEYDFVVSPGADPNAIRFRLKGADQIEIDSQGNLVLKMAKGAIIQRAPAIYQEINGKKQTVPGRYVLNCDKDVGFQVAVYDTTKPLIIDPALVYSTYLGGSSDDEGYDVAVDNTGNVYLTGRTESGKFPTQGPIQPNYAGDCDVFVTKIGPDANLFTVTKTTDTADGICDTDCSLREAIMAANASPGTDTIMLPAGTYTLTITGIDEDGSAIGDLDITDHLTINGAGAADTIIDGGGIDRVFHVDPTSSEITVDISDLIIRNGSAPNAANIANRSGGGIDNRGTLTLTNVAVSDNTATFVGGSGGGLSNTGTLALNSVTVSDNTGYYAGGIHNAGTMTLINSSISNNTSSGSIGSAGGIWNQGNATLMNSDVSGNTARVGGGIRNLNPHILTLINTTISGNIASSTRGGGIYNEGVLELTNSTLSGNIANTDGGGIFNSNLVALASVTIGGNEATTGQGGGIYNEAEIQIETTILSNNTSWGVASNCELPTGGNFTDFGYNLEDADTCGFTGTGDIINTDPLLGPLQDNGGPTFTHALLTGSPAIDAGDNTGCPATDQRGVTRPQDGNGDGNAICDIGAYEYNPYDYADELAVDFSTSGLWHYNGSTWTQLNGQNPEGMEEWNGGLAGDFGASGLWNYNGSSWNLLTTLNPQSMEAWDSSLVVYFAGNGLWSYDGATWSLLTTNTAETMQAWSGGIAVDFGSFGLWNYNGSAWSLLTTSNADGMESWANGLAVDFGSFGLWSYNGSSWSLLTTNNPETMQAWSGGLATDFGSFGLWNYNGSSWSLLTTSNASGMADWNGGVAVNFSSGLWSYNGSSWDLLTTTHPEDMEGWATSLAADLGTSGLWNYNGSAWSQLTAWNAEDMIDVDLY